MLLLSWNFLFSGESECTRPNHHCKKIFLTQPDDDVSAVNKNCISVVKLQDRSHGAKRAYRVREIRTALAAPPKVRAKMISSTMLRIKCQTKSGLINPKIANMHSHIVLNSNPDDQDLSNQHGLDHNLGGHGVRDANATDSAFADPIHKPQTTIYKSAKVQRGGIHSDDEFDNNSKTSSKNTSGRNGSDVDGAARADTDQRADMERHEEDDTFASHNFSQHIHNLYANTGNNDNNAKFQDPNLNFNNKESHDSMPNKEKLTPREWQMFRHLQRKFEAGRATKNLLDDDLAKEHSQDPAQIAIRAADVVDWPDDMHDEPTEQ